MFALGGGRGGGGGGGMGFPTGRGRSYSPSAVVPLLLPDVILVREFGRELLPEEGDMFILLLVGWISSSYMGPSVS